nr:MAG TPA: Minor capsid protein [Caudoviricetes sp.]
MNTSAIFLRRLRLAIKESIEEVIDTAKQTHKFKNHPGNKLEREGLEAYYGQYVGVITLSRRVGYAGYVHEGFPAHKIKPKFRKALRWVANGDFRWAAHVMHPGFKGDPFLYRAFDGSQGTIERIFDKQVELACQEVENGFIS